MRTRAGSRLAVALTIAGSDSGGGAGIQADLKTFAALGVHGTSAITCLTAQNPGGVRGIEACSAEMVRQQMEAVFDGLSPAAIKTGMLYSREIIRAVSGCLGRRKNCPLVVDPVMVATSGARLLQPSAIRALRADLLPMADLVTPNLDEAALLVGRSLRDVEDLRTAARAIHAEHGCPVLVKGGHLRGMREAADVLFDGLTEWLLTAPFAVGVSTHGTGCTYAAAITAHLARGRSLIQAVREAKQFITRSITGSLRVHDSTVLNWFGAA